MLTEPRDAFAEQSSFIDYLLGVAGMGRMVCALGVEAGRVAAPPDDLVYLLLGVASIGAAIEDLTENIAGQSYSTSTIGDDGARWLR